MKCETCGDNNAKEYRNVYNDDEPNRIWCSNCLDDLDTDYCQV